MIGPKTGIRVAHTADLDAATLEQARSLLFEVFTGDDAMTDEDWEHCVGGMHALAYDDGELVGHASVVMRRLLHGDRALRAGYVEGVAVREDRQGRGHGAGMMAELERIIRRAYDLGALGATEVAVPFYRGRGWQPWRGETWALTTTGPVRTPDEDGWIYVLPAAATLDLDGNLVCGIRPGEAW